MGPLARSSAEVLRRWPSFTVAGLPSCASEVAGLPYCALRGMCVSPVEGGPFVHRSRTPSRCRRVVSALPSTRFSQMNRPTDQSRCPNSKAMMTKRAFFRSLSDCRKRADSLLRAGMCVEGGPPPFVHRSRTPVMRLRSFCIGQYEILQKSKGCYTNRIRLLKTERESGRTYGRTARWRGGQEVSATTTTTTTTTTHVRLHADKAFDERALTILQRLLAAFWTCWGSGCGETPYSGLCTWCSRTVSPSDKPGDHRSTPPTAQRREYQLVVAAVAVVVVVVVVIVANTSSPPRASSVRRILQCFSRRMRRLAFVENISPIAAEGGRRASGFPTNEGLAGTTHLLGALRGPADERRDPSMPLERNAGVRCGEPGLDFALAPSGAPDGVRRGKQRAPRRATPLQFAKWSPHRPAGTQGPATANEGIRRTGNVLGTSPGAKSLLGQSEKRKNAFVIIVLFSTLAMRGISNLRAGAGPGTKGAPYGLSPCLFKGSTGVPIREKVFTKTHYHYLLRRMRVATGKEGPPTRLRFWGDPPRPGPKSPGTANEGLTNLGLTFGPPIPFPPDFTPVPVRARGVRGKRKAVGIDALHGSRSPASPPSSSPRRRRRRPPPFLSPAPPGPPPAGDPSLRQRPLQKPPPFNALQSGVRERKGGPLYFPKGVGSPGYGTKAFKNYALFAPFLGVTGSRVRNKATDAGNSNSYTPFTRLFRSVGYLKNPCWGRRDTRQPRGLGETLRAQPKARLREGGPLSGDRASGHRSQWKKKGPQTPPALPFGARGPARNKPNAHFPHFGARGPLPLWADPARLRQTKDRIWGKRFTGYMPFGAHWDPARGKRPPLSPFPRDFTHVVPRKGAGSPAGKQGLERRPPHGAGVRLSRRSCCRRRRRRLSSLAPSPATGPLRRPRPLFSLLDKGAARVRLRKEGLLLEHKKALRDGSVNKGGRFPPCPWRRGDGRERRPFDKTTILRPYRAPGGARLR
ncbi:unnamed protein product [Acanthosepion pharaonis]|uniref:Uncharacterized protein n=1 Tax=Acanthosepion pharaonis TaxID=158019 RepID=A0A812E696_ACAPH|nr:unnamed protein product [Sepia pharaonis]